MRPVPQPLLRAAPAALQRQHRPSAARLHHWERYINPSTDKLIDSSRHDSTAVQHSIVDQLEQVMLSDVPVIPMTEEVDCTSTTPRLSPAGSPAEPVRSACYLHPPDDEVLLLHLTPK